jgi:hypothetical protein
MRADTTPTQWSFIRQFEKALNDLIAQTGATPAIVLVNPWEIDRLKNLGAESVEYRTKLFYLGVEVGPDPRVMKGVAVACDRNLAWLGAFPLTFSAPERTVNMTQEEWDAWDKAIEASLHPAVAPPSA